MRHPWVGRSALPPFTGCPPGEPRECRTDVPGRRARRGARRQRRGAGRRRALINEDSGFERTTVSNESGEYAFPNVAPGVYTLRAALAGFKTFESRGIRVGTQDFLTLDLRLEVGESSEAITVTGATPVIETTNAVGRHAASIAGRSRRCPTSVAIPSSSRSSRPTSFRRACRSSCGMQDQNATAMLSLGGGPRRANNFLLDGVPITDIFNRAAIIPSIEAVEEVKVQVSTYDAELGRTGGGVFNTHAQIGVERLARQRAGARSAAMGHRQAVLRAEDAAIRSPRRTTTSGAGRSAGRSSGIARSSGRAPKGTRRRRRRMPRPHHADRARTSRRLFAVLRCARAADRHLRPADDAPGPGASRDSSSAIRFRAMSFRPIASIRWAGLWSTCCRCQPPGDRCRARRCRLRTSRIRPRSKSIIASTDRQTLSGVFAWYHSSEPAPQFSASRATRTRSSSRAPSTSSRSTTCSMPSDRTVLALRYGYMRFRDDFASAPSDPSTLGFSPAFASAISGFPRITRDRLRGVCRHAVQRRHVGSRARSTPIRRTRRCRGWPAATRSSSAPTID